MSTCRSCGAEIRWIKTSGMKLHPINDDPIERWVMLNGIWVFKTTYSSHFSTCPQADAWKKNQLDLVFDTQPSLFDIPKKKG